MTEDKHYKSVEWLLYHYNSMKISIENMKEKLKISGVSGINYDDPVISPTYKFNSRVENEAIRVEEFADKLRNKIAWTQVQIDSIDRALNTLSQPERDIIKMRYFDGLQWWEISGQIKACERHCKRIRNKAMQKIIIALCGLDKEYMNIAQK